MSHDPGHPGAVDDGWGSGGGVTPLGWLRTVVAAVFGVAAVILLATAWLLSVAAVHVTVPDRPGRVVAVALAVPQLRADAADSFVSDVEERLPQGLAPTDRGVLVDSVDDALASVEVEQALVDLRVVDGTFDARPFLAMVSDQLSDEAGQSAESGEAAAVLRQLATGAADPGIDGVGPVDPDFATGMSALRHLTLGAAAVVAVPGAISALICAVVARRRVLACVGALSGSLLLAALALTDVGSAAAPAGVGEVLSAIGPMAGTGTTWILVLAALLPPALWAAVRSRGQRDSSTITS